MPVCLHTCLWAPRVCVCVGAWVCVCVWVRVCLFRGNRQVCTRVSCFAHSGGNQAQFWTLGRRWSRPNLWNEGKTPSGWGGGDVAAEVTACSLSRAGGSPRWAEPRCSGGDDLKGHLGPCGDCQAGASGVFHSL